MFVTLSGMTREVIPWQPQNDSSHMRVTELGMVILDNFSHSEYLQLIVYQFVLIKTVEK